MIDYSKPIRKTTITGKNVPVYKTPTQEKTATPKTVEQVILPDENYNLSKVTIEPVTSSIDDNIQPQNILLGKTILGVQGNLAPDKPDQNKTVVPTTSEQIVVADTGYELAQVTVEAVDSDIDNNIVPENIKEGITILGVQGNLAPDKPDQSKTATPTTNQQVIRADTGYELAQVTVEGVTSSIDSNIQASNIKDGVTILGVEGTLQEGITPTGALEITANGTYDVTNYASANVNVSGGTEPTTTSATNFKFSGEECKGYTGDNDAPEITIPITYGIEVGEPVQTVGARVLDTRMFQDEARRTDFMQATFSNGADFERTYRDNMELDMLTPDFEGQDCYFVSIEVPDPLQFADLLRMCYEMSIIQFPITINDTICNNGEEAFQFIEQNTPNQINFAGEVTLETPIDGYEYFVKSITSSSGTSGFLNYSGNIICLDNIKEIGSYAFYQCTNLKKITLSSKTKSLGESAFSQSGIEEIIIPNSVTTVSVSAFSGCSNLKNAILSTGITTLSNSIFNDCTNLTNITIPDSVTMIESSAFRDCSALTNITIPSNVTSIGSSVFYGCTNLATVTLEATTPPRIQTNTFPDNVQRYEVPAESVETYKSATNWAKYADKIFAKPTV